MSRIYEMYHANADRIWSIDCIHTLSKEGPDQTQWHTLVLSREERLSPNHHRKIDISIQLVWKYELRNKSWHLFYSNIPIYYTHLPNGEVLNTKVAQSVSCPRFEQKLDGYLNFWIPCGLNLQIFLNFSYLCTSATTYLYILKCLTLAEAGVK
jgi:hypothetical protein